MGHQGQTPPPPASRATQNGPPPEGTKPLAPDQPNSPIDSSAHPDLGGGLRHGQAGPDATWKERNRVDTRRAIGGIVRRWWLLLPLTLIGATLGYAASFQVRPVYQATTSVFIGQIFEDPNVTKDYVEATQSLTATYADVVRRQPILEDVVTDLRLRAHWTQLRDRVRIHLPPSNPQLIEITVDADSPQDAEVIAAEIADRLVAMSPTESEIAETDTIKSFVQSRLVTLQEDIQDGQRELDFLEGKSDSATSTQDRNTWERRIEAQQKLIADWVTNYSSLLSALATKESPNTLRILETANSSGVPVEPNRRRNTALGAGAALCLAMGIAYALEFRRSRGGRDEPPVLRPADDRSDSQAGPSDQDAASTYRRA